MIEIHYVKYEDFLTAAKNQSLYFDTYRVISGHGDAGMCLEIFSCIRFVDIDGHIHSATWIDKTMWQRYEDWADREDLMLAAKERTAQHSGSLSTHSVAAHIRIVDGKEPNRLCASILEVLGELEISNGSD